MKVLWFVNGMMPDMAVALGLGVGHTGGWMPSLISALRRYAPDVELSFICEWKRDAAVEVDGRWHFAIKRMDDPLRFVGRSSRAEFGRKIKTIVERVKPDIIHFHGTENGYVGFPDEVWCGVPRLVSLQGVINGIFPHYLGGLTPRQLRPYRNWIRYLATGHDLFAVADSWRVHVARGEAESLSQIRYIAGRTDWDCAWAHALSPKCAYYHVGEIMRPEFYEERKDKRQRRPCRIFASAAFKYPLKGGHTLLESVAILKRDFPDVKLVVADSLSKIAPARFLDRIRTTEYHRFLRHKIRELGLTDNVELLPALNAARVVEELEKATVYCQASFVENSPNSLAEAQLVGTPVVATYAGGIPSMVDHNHTGFLVMPGDHAALASAIHKLFTDLKKANEMAFNAREVALHRHDPVAIVSDLLACYQAVRSRG